MSAKIFLPIDGDFTSHNFTDLLKSMGVSEDAITATRPHISKAVIDAQIGQGLSKFEGIAQVAVDAAPQVVANGKDASQGVQLS